MHHAFMAIRHSVPALCLGRKFVHDGIGPRIEILTQRVASILPRRAITVLMYVKYAARYRRVVATRYASSSLFLAKMIRAI